MRQLAAVVAVLILTGCLASGRQTYFDKSRFEYTYFDEEGNVDYTEFVYRDIQGKNTLLAPPFGATAVSTLGIYMDEAPVATEAGDLLGRQRMVNMGQDTQLDGGELATTIEATAGLVGEIAEVAGGVATGGASTVVGELLDTDE